MSGRHALSWLLAPMLLLVPATADAQRKGTTTTADVHPTKASTVEVSMVVGENKTLPAADVASYSVGSQGIVDLKVTPDMNQFVLVGLRPGSTTVLMLKKSGIEVTYAVTVFARSPDAVEKEIGRAHV